MNNFLDIIQCLQVISVTDDRKMNTKGKVISWHTNRHMYTCWEGMVKGEGPGGSRDWWENWPPSGRWTSALIIRHVKHQTSELICNYFNSTPVNMITQEHASQSSRKLKMAAVRLKDVSHFGSRTFWVKLHGTLVILFVVTIRLSL